MKLFFFFLAITALLVGINAAPTEDKPDQEDQPQEPSIGSMFSDFVSAALGNIESIFKDENSNANSDNTEGGNDASSSADDQNADVQASDDQSNDEAPAAEDDVSAPEQQTETSEDKPSIGSMFNDFVSSALGNIGNLFKDENSSASSDNTENVNDSSSNDDSNSDVQNADAQNADEAAPVEEDKSESSKPSIFGDLLSSALGAFDSFFKEDSSNTSSDSTDASDAPTDAPAGDDQNMSENQKADAERLV